MQKMKVLIVDDDIVDRELITRTLQRSNIAANISEVETVDEALIKLNEINFDAVLLDYNLPSRKGIDLLVELKRNINKPSIAVIVMSSTSNDEIALNCINAGAQDFLNKTEINVFRLQRAIVNAKARSELEKELYLSYQKTKQLAEHDYLTGLVNRHYFDEALVKSIKSNLREQTTLALLLIDLDHFKYVNDNYGHDIGDHLLIKVVERIKTCLRDNELFARIGGDEFAIVLNGLKSVNGAVYVAQRILNLLKDPFEIAGYSVQSGASIGISISPWDSGCEKVLFKYADIAMYRAKNMGRNQFSFFEEEMQEKFLSDFKIENKLRKGIENNEFIMHYQPVINLQNRQVMGVEALIRWKTDNQIISPDKFIPIAEKTRLIIEIGKWVIDTAIKQLSFWHQGKNDNLVMAINLSSVQLNDDSLFEYLKEKLAHYKIDAKLLEFELTETALIVEPDKTAKMLQKISDLGCKVALDDFGTGFSSLSHLHSFPIDVVKIDKSLMPNEASNNKVKSVLNGLVLMIKSLNLITVAEGVETKEDFELCLKLKVDKIQGYYFDRALEATEFEEKYLK